MTAPQDPYAAAEAVAVAASSIPGEFLVPDLVGRFRAEQPEFTVATTVTDSAGLVRERAGT